MREVDAASPIVEPIRSTSPAAVALPETIDNPVISAAHDNSMLKSADVIVVPETSVFRSVTIFIPLLILEEPIETVLTEVSTKGAQLETAAPTILEAIT